jgi:hypothetical protein
MKGGIYPVLAEARRAIQTRERISLAGERAKLLNYDRRNRDSDNWDKVGHLCELVNLINGHPTVARPEDVVAWWVWLFTETSLMRDEVNSRVYGGVQWEPELIVASLANSLAQLGALRPHIDARMEAWLGAVVPDTVNRQPHKILEHYPERNGTAVFGSGDRIAHGGLCWIGMGDRSWNLDAASGRRMFLEGNGVGELVAIVLEDESARRVGVDLVAPLAARHILIWMPPPEIRAACLRALAGDVESLVEVFNLRNRCPHLYAHTVIGGRCAGNAAWAIMPHGKDGSTAAGAAAYSTVNGEGWMSPLSGHRGAGDGSAVDEIWCEEREMPPGRSAVAWRKSAPQRLIEMGLPNGPDLFRYESGPGGHRVVIPAPAEPVPPPTPQPPAGGGGGKKHSSKGCALLILPLLAALAAAAWAVMP